MITEMARTFRGIGYEQPSPKRSYTQPENELQERFVQWMEGLPEDWNSERDYQSAVQLVKDINATPAEATALLVVDYGCDFEKKRKSAGLFVSAIYNQSGIEELIFDIDADDVDRIGYRFPGMLVNTGSAGYQFGQYAVGLVINNGSAGDSFGEFAKGVVINNGEAGYAFGGHTTGIVINTGSVGNWFGRYAKSLVITLTEPQGYGFLSLAERVLFPASCARIPQLKEYLDSLAEETKRLKDASLEEIKGLEKRLNAKVIEENIRRIVGV